MEVNREVRAMSSSGSKRSQVLDQQAASQQLFSSELEAEAAVM